MSGEKFKWCAACQRSKPAETFVNKAPAGKLPQWRCGDCITGKTPTAKSGTQLTFRGKTQGYGMWAAETGIPRGTIKMRIKRGWTTEQALTTKVEEEAA